MSGTFFRSGQHPPPPRVPPPTYGNPRHIKLYNAWLAFHEANPRVYKMICKYAQEAIDADHKHYGIAAIFEVMRWDFTVRTQDPTFNFKFPNNHRAFYSRMWNRNHPEHFGFLREARQRSGYDGPADEFGRPI